ncbi:MAG: hypothetical protein LBG43_11720 [Treponema sp.]|nr:hypothetical protein [Treponema sp.]
MERENARKVILAPHATAEKAECNPDGKDARHADDHYRGGGPARLVIRRDTCCP